MSGFKSRLIVFLAVLAALVAVGLLAAPAAWARDWHVPTQAPTIQAAVDSAISGDAIVIAPGTYTDCTNPDANGVPHIAILRNGIDLRGETGDPAHVILDAQRLGRCLELRSFADTTRISGITFRRGRAANPFGSGGGVFAFAAHLEFRDCVFDSCEADYAGGGVNVAAGSLAIEDCVFVDCATANIGAAVRATTSPLRVTGVTIFRSRGPALHYAGVQPVITRTIIAGGDARAITRNNTSDPLPDITCTDLWDNGENWTDFLAGLAATGGNLAVDPQFCNPLFGNLGLYSTSPCAPDESGTCGRIGGRPVSCGLGAVTRVVQPDGSGAYPTIQAAINAAVDADTVALADGVFTGTGNRDLDLLGKGIVVRGLNRDPDLAIIDCGASPADPHRGFHIFRGENSFTVLRDLTIRNADVADDGAAVLIENSSPRLVNVVFTANHARSGAALHVAGGAPAITGCVIAANEGRTLAGGFSLRASAAVITDCLFRSNWGQRASALFLPDSSNVTVLGTTFNANNSAGDRACIELEGNSVLTLANCQITNGNRTALRTFGAATASASYTNVYANAEGDWTAGLSGQGFGSGNLSVDPLYCDPAGLDFTLRGDSRCTAANSGNGKPMGAFDAGCDAPSVFSDVSLGVPATTTRSTGVAWLDYNGDGLADLHVTRPFAADGVLLGSGLGLFNDLGDPVAAATDSATATAWADFDGDGDWDAYHCRTGADNVLVAGEGFGFAVQDLPAATAGMSGPAAAWADYDRDSRLDLLVVRRDTTCILLKQGPTAPFFSNVSTAMKLTQVGPWSGAAWVDYDNDGRRDLYLLADGAENRLLHNLAAGFESVASVPVQDSGRARSAAWADFSNDGRPDLLLVNDGSPSVILRQVGTGTFTKLAIGALVTAGPGRSGVWGDYDNDGDLDVFIARCGQRDQLLRNDGSDAFLDVGEPAFATADSSTGAAWGDYDNDGDLDLVVADLAGRTRLYRNDLAGTNHWLRVRVGGAAPVPGTKVRIRTSAGVQLREPGAGGGFHSQDEMVAHFGLAAVTTVDTVRVVWPDGRKRVLVDVAADQVLVVSTPAPSAVPDETPRLVTGLQQVAPNPFNPLTNIRFATDHKAAVRLRVYDVAGRLVAELLHEEVPAGRHVVGWRGRDQAGRTVAAGVYFVHLQVAGRTWTRAVTLLK